MPEMNIWEGARVRESEPECASDTLCFQWKDEVLSEWFLCSQLPAPAPGINSSLPLDFTKCPLSLSCSESSREKKEASTSDSNSQGIAKGTDVYWAECLPGTSHMWISYDRYTNLGGEKIGRSAASIIDPELDNSNIISVQEGLCHTWGVTLYPPYRKEAYSHLHFIGEKLRHADIERVKWE